MTYNDKMRRVSKLVRAIERTLSLKEDMSYRWIKRVVTRLLWLFHPDSTFVPDRDTWMPGDVGSTLNWLLTPAMWSTWDIMLIVKDLEMPVGWQAKILAAASRHYRTQEPEDWVYQPDPAPNHGVPIP